MRMPSSCTCSTEMALEGGVARLIDIESHQSLGDEAEHVAEEFGVGALFKRRLQRILSSVIVVLPGLDRINNPLLAGEPR
jgi:hypothetical protein